MTCAWAPQSPDDFLRIIDHCATLAGGPHWMTQATLGLATLAVILFAVVVVAMVLGRLAR